MIVLYILTAVGLLASLIASPARTWAAIKLAATRFGRILPSFLLMMALFSAAMTLLPQEVLLRLLGRQSGPLGVGLAALLGSVTLMPGFIAFPLSGALLKQGVPYTVLAAFTTTLMMVGVVTYPLERQYFGRKVTIVRNAVSLAIALLVAAVTGLVFREIVL
jgi:uncharacterized membrane protein YraQ (UPF0718 family)